MLNLNLILVRSVGAPLLAVPALAACAAPSSYMGISLKPNAADADLQQQVRSAMNGDKLAQLDLGIRFEEGRGVIRDLNKAKKLYRQAAADSGGTTWIYTPSVQAGQPGRVLPLGKGMTQKGLNQAKQRLAALEEKE